MIGKLSEIIKFTANLIQGIGHKKFYEKISVHIFFVVNLVLDDNLFYFLSLGKSVSVKYLVAFELDLSDFPYLIINGVQK